MFSEMPNEDQDLGLGGDDDIEMRSDENVELKTQTDIKLLSTQVSPHELFYSSEVFGRGKVRKREGRGLSRNSKGPF